VKKKKKNQTKACWYQMQAPIWGEDRRDQTKDGFEHTLLVPIIIWILWGQELAGQEKREKRHRPN